MKRWYAGCLAVLMSAAAATAAAAEVAITADELTYRGAADTVDARGHVVVKKDTATLEGDSGSYVLGAGTAVLRGGVRYTDAARVMTATTLTWDGGRLLTAEGDVRLADGDRMLIGSYVRYDTVDGYAHVRGSATVRTGEAEMQAGEIEAYTREIRLIGSGGVSLRQYENEFTATGDRITYTQTPGADDGYAVLEGDATATQSGHTVRGPRLDIRLQDRVVETKGRSTLIIQTKE